MPVEPAHGTVIVSPGNSGSMACYLLTAQLLTDDGYSVVIYDYEGFGGSSGQASLETLRPDLETFRKKPGKPRPRPSSPVSSPSRSSTTAPRRNWPSAGAAC